MSDAAAEVIESDLACVGCGYNLRTLARAAGCPECGRAVEDAVALDLLNRSELGHLRAKGVVWLQTAHAGMTRVWTAWLASLLGLASALSLEPPWSEDVLPASLWLFPFVGVFVLSNAAAWRLFAVPMWPMLRRCVRAALLAGVLAIGLIFANDRWAAYYRRALEASHMLPPASALHAANRIGCVASLVWPLIIAAVFARMLCIAWLARRTAACVTLGTWGVLGAFAMGLLAASLIDDGSPSASSNLVAILVGPTGTLPFAWMAVSAIVLQQSHGPHGLTTSVVITALVVAAAYAATGHFLHSLRRDLTRAIQLFESPASSSRS